MNPSDFNVNPSTLEFVLCAAAPAGLIAAAVGLLLYAFGGLTWDLG